MTTTNITNLDKISDKMLSNRIFISLQINISPKIGINSVKKINMTKNCLLHLLKEDGTYFNAPP